MSKKKLPSVKALDFPRGSRIDEDIFSRWPQNVRAANDDENTITIYEPIGEDFFGGGFTAKKMAAALKAIGKKDVTVSINSPGGDFFEGATIYNLLREHPGRVTVKIPGLAASAASLIAMAGDSIQISEIGFFMIHDAWGIVIGNRHDMTKAAATFEVFDSAMADVYAARTGLDREEIVKMLDNDTWLNGTNAIEKGFADELLPAKSIEDTKDGKQSQALARRTLEMVMARQGYSRKERAEIFKEAFGARDAAEEVARDADSKTEESVKDLIKTIKN